jgi:hypothetical protein
MVSSLRMQAINATFFGLPQKLAPENLTTSISGFHGEIQAATSAVVCSKCTASGVR